MSANASSPHGPLRDVRVLDLTHHVAGPFCTKLLADYGADVIKVERPDGGDPLRLHGPFQGDRPHPDAGGLFVYLNTNKRGITLDLHATEDLRRLRELIAESDVLVENFKPGTLARLGLDSAALRALNPRLVTCSISNFGQTGPYRDFAASELVLQAMSGFTFGSGEPQREPVWIPLYLAQQIAGLTAYINCLAALRHARATGAGLDLDISILESLMEVQEMMMGAYFYSGFVRQRLGHRRETNHPANILPCKDGYVPVLVVFHRDWQELARMMGHPEMADDPRFSTGPGRAEHADEIDAALVPWLSEHTGEEVYHLAQERRIPVSRVLDARGIFELPHLRARGFFREVMVPGVGPLEVPGPPFIASPRSEGPVRPAPRLGEHNAEILRPSAAVAVTPAQPPERSQSPPAMRRRPLEGIRIADLTHVWAGPKCTQILADLGAEVIKIESPTRTDPARGSTNLLGLERYPNRERGAKPYDRNGYFNTTSRNKYGITLDLRQAEGLEAFKKLVSSSDVVVENFSAGVMQRLGLGYDVLKALQPNIVMVSMSGFGATGPDSASPAWAETVEAMAGLPMLTGYPSGQPTLTFQAISDPLGGTAGAAAVLTALHHQAATGEGQYIDLSQQEALLSLYAEPLLDYAMNRRVRPRSGNQHPAMAPHGVYACRDADTWVAIAVHDEAAWNRFRNALGDPAWAADPRFASLAGRLEHHADLDARVSAWTQGLTPTEVMRVLQAANVASGPAYSIADLVVDPHLAARGVFQSIDHAEVGPYTYYVPAPVHYGSRLLDARKSAPCFGADNAAILRDVLGYDETAIAALEARHVIAGSPLEAVLIG